jgi:hypothetical protein
MVSERVERIVEHRPVQKQVGASQRLEHPACQFIESCTCHTPVRAS